MKLDARRITLVTLFGAAVFTSKILLPSPLDKMTIIVQATFLTLGSLLARPAGATLVAATGAALTALVRLSLAPFTVAFALTYGFLTDVLILILGAISPELELRTARLVAAVTISTAVTGLASYYATVHVLGLMPRNYILEVVVLVVGVISGLLGGYGATLIWKRIRPTVPPLASPSERAG